jgi:pyrroloquinoline-quinone synthase
MTKLSDEHFVEQMRAVGDARYHDKHPFNVAMHEGRLSRSQLQAWVMNRFYYQTRIPIKDAIILSKSEDPAFRRLWIHRITDHDGMDPGQGGLELWLRLAHGVGLDRDAVVSLAHVLPAVRFACDAYVELVRREPLLVAVASSLTEHFAPGIMAKHIAAWEKHYPWVSPDVLDYFRVRVSRARGDAEEGLAFVLAHATTRESQDACLAALSTKCDILWALLDAVHAQYVEPGGREIPAEALGALP